MSIPITFNGVSYEIPEFRDVNYANDLTNFFVAIPNGTLQPASGMFTLLAELNFGTSFGIQAKQLALGAALDSSSILSISSTTKGFLPPRMTTAQRDAIVSPTAGLSVYNTDTETHNFYNGVSWLSIAAGGTINPGTQYQLGYYASTGDTISGLPLITTLRAIQSDANGLPVASAVTTTELGYLSGVTSAIQSQLNLKAPLASPTFTGVVTMPSPFTLGATSVTASGTEMNYLVGVTSAIQTQLNTKAFDSLVVHLAGTETITGIKTFSEPITQNDTSNQIVLGITNTTTINAIAPAASRVVTIPDPGAAASFVMTEGIQTINGQKTFGATTLHADGTESLPGIAFSSDTDTGITRLAANRLGFSVNGATRLQIRTTDIEASLPFYQADGSAAAPSYSFANDTDIGMYRSAANQISIATNGTARLNISNSDVTATVPLQSINGTASVPAFTFSNDLDTGLYLSAANTLALTSAGTVAMTLSSSAVIVRTGHNLDPDGAGTQNFGNASDYWNDISYKTLTDRGCLPWCDNGVEMQDGTIVSDLEALCAIEKHPTEITIQGLPKLDYSTFPKKAYKPADKNGCLLPRDKENLPIGGADGVEMTMIFGVMIGAFKQLKAENDELKARVAALESK